MTQDINPKELEKKVYRSYHRDGILDISLGLLILLFGIAMYTHLIPFVGLIPIMVMSAGYLAKKFVIIPRMGHVNFSNARKEKERGKMSFWLVLGIVVLGAVLVGLAKRNILPGLDSVLQTYPLLALAVIVSSLIIAAALMFGAVHLYAYAALVLIVLVPCQSIYAPEPHRVVFAGTFILLCGLLTFIRFLRKYPLPEKEASDVSHN
ncbi:MAG: hypothetical protein C4B59_05815 [Candidatus Methanogaster sp.]|uniref:Uncharacterized protein n=1 Tax=Candidatus Methanogaster sp. TaxID=3386292 RepID=A0AC61L3X6_9EURY|nr:MAG: hypothetical protein C4B59_05815 [ANME-2 cluster archaeon]